MAQDLLEPLYYFRAVRCVMALSKASALFSSRVITTGQCMTPPLARRWLFDFGKSSEALFTEVDVIPSDERFLKPLSVKDYERMDDSLYRPLFVTPGPFYKRLATIVPLYDMKKTIVVPIPCVIDTGAPAFLLLGTAARNALFHHKLLTSVLLLPSEVGYTLVQAVLCRQ